MPGKKVQCPTCPKIMRSDNLKRHRDMCLLRYEKDGIVLRCKKIKPPPASKLPPPPKDWLENKNDFCKHCENIFYGQDNTGVLRQITYHCDCDDYVL